MKKILIIFFLLFSVVFADVLAESYKIYSKDADELFMSAISAISLSNKYKIEEIQSRNGYILFLYGSRYYLLTLTKRYQNQTEIKILPQNSDYSQGSIVAQNVFSLIDSQLNQKPMRQVK